MNLGTQYLQDILDPGLGEGDGSLDFCRGVERILKNRSF